MKKTKSIEELREKRLSSLEKKVDELRHELDRLEGLMLQLCRKLFPPDPELESEESELPPSFKN